MNKSLMLHKSKLHTLKYKFSPDIKPQLPSFALNHLIENVVPSWSVGFYDVLYGSPTDRATRIDLSLEPQSTVITQTHVSTCIDDGVDLLIEAHCALTALAAQGRI